MWWWGEDENEGNLDFFFFFLKWDSGGNLHLPGPGSSVEETA